MNGVKNNGKKSLSILLVDDDAGDRMLTEKTLKLIHRDVIVSSVKDGDEALQFLKRKDRHVDAQRPDLILLDLNIPKKNGHEVLEEIRADRTLTGIPVIILSTSEAPEDISRSYSLYANAFVSKSADLEQFRKSMESLFIFWCQVAKVPGP